MKNITTYSKAHQRLHWLLALLILGMLASGWLMTDVLSAPFKYQVYGVHKALGILVLAFVLLRVLVRLRDGVPPALPMPRWQHWAAEGAHGLLYALMILMPLTGWVMSSAGGYPISFFGLFAIPPIVAPDAVLGATANQLHEWGKWGFLGLLSVHILATLKHQFIDKDNLLRRMWG